MSQLRRGPLVLIIFGAAFMCILLSLSKAKPGNHPQKVDPYLAKIDLAVAYMQQGQGPMAGIKLLKKVAAEYPNRYEAPFQLGNFSMTSGQYDKATQWFAKASKVAVGDAKIAALLNWSDALVMTAKKDSAILILKEVKRYSTDAELLSSVEDRINELK